MQSEQKDYVRVGLIIIRFWIIILCSQIYSAFCSLCQYHLFLHWYSKKLTNSASNSPTYPSTTSHFHPTFHCQFTIFLKITKYIFMHAQHITHLLNTSNIITPTLINTIKFILFCDMWGIFFSLFWWSHIFVVGIQVCR